MAGKTLICFHSSRGTTAQITMGTRGAIATRQTNMNPILAHLSTKWCGAVVGWSWLALYATNECA
eukprot:10093889-Lingulodinium_polyedra.AAC.1